MSENFKQVKCALLSINDDRLLLPNASLVEIVPIRNIINVANKPKWVLGYLDWKGNSIPLVSIEAMAGVHMPSLASGDVKAVVVYALNGGKESPFLSFLVQGAPTIVNVFETDVVADSQEAEHPVISHQIMLKGEQVSILDLEKLEALIKSVLG